MKVNLNKEAGASILIHGGPSLANQARGHTEVVGLSGSLSKKFLKFLF